MKDQSALLAALQREISDRLKPICGDLSEESFAELVRDIALVKLKYGAEPEVSASLKLRLDQMTSEPPDDPGDSSAT